MDQAINEMAIALVNKIERDAMQTDCLTIAIGVHMMRNNIVNMEFTREEHAKLLEQYGDVDILTEFNSERNVIRVRLVPHGQSVGSLFDDDEEM